MGVTVGCARKGPAVWDTGAVPVGCPAPAAGCRGAVAAAATGRAEWELPWGGPAAAGYGGWGSEDTAGPVPYTSGAGAAGGSGGKIAGVANGPLPGAAA